MKKRKNIKFIFVISILIAFALTLFGISFTAIETANADGKELGQQLEKPTLANAKSARLLAVLDDKIEKTFNANKTIADIKIVYGFNGDYSAVLMYFIL